MCDQGNYYEKLSILIQIVTARQKTNQFKMRVQVTATVIYLRTIHQIQVQLKITLLTQLQLFLITMRN